MEMPFQLIYASAAAVPFTQDDLEQLLGKARKRNNQLRISGLLIHHRGSFLQVMEGPKTEVEQLYAMIARDPRHTKHVLIRRAYVDECSFDGWSMGFVNTRGRTTPPIPGYLDYLTDIYITPDLLNSDMAWWAISEFRKGNWRQRVMLDAFGEIPALPQPLPSGPARTQIFEPSTGA
jgi:hypothetical protein